MGQRGRKDEEVAVKEAKGTDGLRKSVRDYFCLEKDKVESKRKRKGKNCLIKYEDKGEEIKKN